MRHIRSTALCKLQTSVEICILAGGLSTRMGRDKARLRVSGRSLLSRVRALAQPFAKPRVIRKDRVPRCGPLGGLVTGLKTARAPAVLFLACDMPFVSERLLRNLIAASGGGRSAFVTQNGLVGFPFVIPASQLRTVERQIVRGEFSLQRLASALEAARIPVPQRSRQLFNVNTPADLRMAEAWTVAGTKRRSC